jgi:hypothetical protein
MLGTLAAVATRATARAAERYGRRRILTAITGGVTLADVLLRATTKELPRLPQRTASLPVLAAREASAALPWPASASPVMAMSLLRGVKAGVAEDGGPIPRARSCRAAGTKRTRPVHVRT